MIFVPQSYAPNTIMFRQEIEHYGPASSIAMQYIRTVFGKSTSFDIAYGTEHMLFYIVPAHQHLYRYHNDQHHVD